LKHFGNFLVVFNKKRVFSWILLVKAIKNRLFNDKNHVFLYFFRKKLKNCSVSLKMKD